jgi:hypothetical protein
MLRAVDGSVATALMTFLDEDDTTIIPAPGYPRVALLDKDKTVIAQYNASPTANPGEWEAAVSLPNLGVERTDEYRLRWRMRAANGEKYQNFDTMLIDPRVDRRDSEIVVLDGDDTVELALPFAYFASNTPSKFQVYSGNNEVLSGAVSFEDPSVTKTVGAEKTLVSFPAIMLMPSLKANLLIVKSKINGRPRTYSYRYWCITPQIALAATMIEDFLNKSRIQNVIPELEYTAGDILGYLERGLYLFNMTAATTTFTGTNMQGMLLDAWITCASYYALATQLIAEGSLAFDFSGQGISLNVDRTPQLDAALGRIEARIQDTVVPLKKQITQQGFFGGDGSQGGTAMRNPYATGILSLTNSPTTRVNGFSNFVGRRF